MRRCCDESKIEEGSFGQVPGARERKKRTDRIYAKDSKRRRRVEVIGGKDVFTGQSANGPKYRNTTRREAYKALSEDRRVRHAGRKNRHPM